MNISRGWEICEKASMTFGINLRDNYGNIPWMVTENGMGFRMKKQFMDKRRYGDDYRITFIKTPSKVAAQGTYRSDAPALLAIIEPLPTAGPGPTRIQKPVWPDSH